MRVSFLLGSVAALSFITGCSTKDSLRPELQKEDSTMLAFEKRSAENRRIGKEYRKALDRDERLCREKGYETFTFCPSSVKVNTKPYAEKYGLTAYDVLDADRIEYVRYIGKHPGRPGHWKPIPGRPADSVGSTDRFRRYYPLSRRHTYRYHKYKRYPSHGRSRHCTFRCRDGTCSHARTSRGACSHHGGIRW